MTTTEEEPKKQTDVLELLDPHEREMAVKMIAAIRGLRKFSAKWREATSDVSGLSEVRRSKDLFHGLVQCMGAALARVISGDMPDKDNPLGEENRRE